ncbi:MAG: ferredoxin [Candidatus Pacearchaeota archaeon]|nr:ferredoxin [Candidatus Pacearchaeota archaeon]
MVRIDKDKCIGCGACSTTCQEVFEMGDDGKAQVKANAKKDAKCIKEAIKNCPVEAISK